MVGAIYDFFTLPGQVREANLRRALEDQLRRQFTGHVGGQYGAQNDGKPNWRYATDAEFQVMNEKNREKKHPEQVILGIAKENRGILTVSDVALGANISMDEAKKLLEALVSRGFAELRVRKSGSLVYVIPDMLDKNEPLEDF